MNTNDPRAVRDTNDEFRCCDCRALLLSLYRPIASGGGRVGEIAIQHRRHGSRLRYIGGLYLGDGLVVIRSDDGLLTIGRTARDLTGRHAPRRAPTTGARPDRTLHPFTGRVRAYCPGCGRRQVIDATADLERVLPGDRSALLQFRRAGVTPRL